MFLDGTSGLIANTRLVHFRSNNVYQIKDIVNACGSEALDLFRFSTVLAGAGRVCGLCRTRSGDGTGARGLGGFLRARLWRGFLFKGRRLFLFKQSRVLRFAQNLCLTLLFLVLLGFIGL